jgi:hypothetical protein
MKTIIISEKQMKTLIKHIKEQLSEKPKLVNPQLKDDKSVNKEKSAPRCAFLCFKISALHQK